MCVRYMINKLSARSCEANMKVSELQGGCPYDAGTRTYNGRQVSHNYRENKTIEIKLTYKTYFKFLIATDLCKLCLFLLL